MRVNSSLQLILLTFLAALITGVLGVIAIMDAIQGKNIDLPSALTGFAGVAYTALFGHASFLASHGAMTSQRNALLGAPGTASPVPMTPPMSSGNFGSGTTEPMPPSPTIPTNT